MNYSISMTATKEQKRDIAMNTPNKDIKEEWVQWATADVNKRSTSDLTFDEANKILKQLNVRTYESEKDPFEYFDAKNTQHKRIMSQLYTLGWTKKVKGREVPDFAAFAQWLKTKSPVKKSLKDMTSNETSRVIFAFGKVVKHIFT